MFRLALGMAGLGLLAAALTPLAAGEKQKAKEPAEKQAAKRDAKEAAKLIEAIANRNKPPKIASRRGYLPHNVPLFPKDYDWKEEYRVHDAVNKLYKDTSAAMWEALIQRKDDRNYCVVRFNEYTTDGEIHSVGRICYDLAYDRLCGVVWSHLPKDPDKDAPLRLKTGVGDLAAWRKDRSDKALYQLQIEVCETALRELAKHKRLAIEAKATLRKKIEDEIAELRKTKRPVVWESHLLHTYSSQIANRIREASEKGTLDKLQIDLIK